MSGTITSDPIVLSGDPSVKASPQFYLDRVTSVHSTKPKFMATMALLMQCVVDVEVVLTQLETLFDLDTAVGEQLDMVGLWIGIGRRVTIPMTNIYFSFDIEGSGFDQAIWYAPFDPLTDVVYLDDDTYRNLLRAKVILNKGDGTQITLYEALDALFEGFPDTTYVIVDHNDMTMTITLGGAQPSLPILSVVMTQVLPLAPMGVALTVVQPWL